jgi:hypothetical protein
MSRSAGAPAVSLHLPDGREPPDRDESGRAGRGERVLGGQLQPLRVLSTRLPRDGLQGGHGKEVNTMCGCARAHRRAPPLATRDLGFADSFPVARVTVAVSADEDVG